MDLDTFIIDRLDAIEARPRMWASSIEALEAMYLALLDVLVFHRGIESAMEDHDGHRIPVCHRIYREETHTGDQGCIPIWARDGQNITHADAVAYLRRVRERVLG